MTVRKDEPMDHVAATDEEFDALLDASSLGAPHVVAETGAIPAIARHRMTHAVQQHRPHDIFDAVAHSRPDDSHPDALAGETRDTRMMLDGILHGATGAGKSLLCTALLSWLDSAYTGTSWVNSHELLVRQPWAEPSAQDPLQRTLRLASLSDGAMSTVRPHCWTGHGDEVLRDDGGLIHFELLNMPSNDRAASVLCGAGDRTQDIPIATSTSAPVTGIVLLHRRAGVPSTLRSLSRLWAEPKRRLRNLGHLMEPSLEPEHSSPVTPTGLFIHSMRLPLARLRIARFTGIAYTTAGYGLLVPKTDGPPRHQYRTRERSEPDHQLRPSTRTGRIKLWRTLVDGMPELSAELPMLFHFDEHESLALTSRLQAKLTYRVSDPYAVEARFMPDGQRAKVWVFARDLLKDGLESWNGLGDVSVWPGTGTAGEPRVFMRLSSPQGSALLSTRDADLRRFVNAGNSLVAHGEEHVHLEPALDALETTIGELARPGRCD